MRFVFWLTASHTVGLTRQDQLPFWSPDGRQDGLNAFLVFLLFFQFGNERVNLGVEFGCLLGYVCVLPILIAAYSSIIPNLSTAAGICEDCADKTSWHNKNRDAQVGLLQGLAIAKEDKGDLNAIATDWPQPNLLGNPCHDANHCTARFTLQKAYDDAAKPHQWDSSLNENKSRLLPRRVYSNLRYKAISAFAV